MTKKTKNRTFTPILSPKTGDFTNFVPDTVFGDIEIHTGQAEDGTWGWTFQITTLGPVQRKKQYANHGLETEDGALLQGVWYANGLAEGARLENTRMLLS